MGDVAATDVALDEVERRLAGIPRSATLFGEAIRRSFDEVLDGQRTGRWRIEDLSKTEKTYIGTKVEILLRDALGLESGEKLDFRIAGHEVDCKFSLTARGWMIPIEAQGELCLLVTASDEAAAFSAGLLRCTPGLLLRPNRDGKRQIAASARSEIRWLWEDAPLPENLLRNLPRQTLDAVFSLSGARQGQARINEFFRLVHRRVVRREVTVTVARQDDGMKRARDARLQLQPEGVIILGHRGEHPRIARELGLPVPGRGELVATRVVPVSRESERSGAPTAAIGETRWREASDDDPVVSGPDLPY